ncbi:MAG TPA: serine/threonine-protein kinase [Polyangiaceae bacterium]|nr:serine/threonine-protein kinase [Polyangiaceae bacterium]
MDEGENTKKDLGFSAPATQPSAIDGVPVREGDILAGKYRVERVLGVGGMGVVVAALHLELDQRVALKFLLPEAMENGEIVERFAREARAAVRIQSEHVARVIDVGRLDSNVPFMVMEYLHGSDLQATLRDHGPLPVAEAVEYVLQACEAIAQAHALGIVHRDLKPANLFLTTRPDGTKSVKVLDFGISKVGAAPGNGASDMSLTRTAAIMGSPSYMSPEQLRASRDVDARSDIWAIGVILFELLTGRPAFLASTMPELCAMILTDVPPVLGHLRSDVPPLLEATIMRCLEKTAARRFANVAELASALADHGPKRARPSAERCARILRGAGVATPSLPPLPSLAPNGRTVGDPAAVAASTAAAWSQAETKPERPTKRLPLATSVILVGGLLLGGAATLLLTRGNSTHSPAKEPARGAAVATSAVERPTTSAPTELPFVSSAAPTVQAAPTAVPVAPPAATPPIAAPPPPSATHADKNKAPAPKGPARPAVAAPASPPPPPPRRAPEPIPPPPAKKNPLNIDIK